MSHWPPLGDLYRIFREGTGLRRIAGRVHLVMPLAVKSSLRVNPNPPERHMQDSISTTKGNLAK